jgi:hypothetical protein
VIERAGLEVLMGGWGSLVLGAGRLDGAVSGAVSGGVGGRDAGDGATGGGVRAYRPFMPAVPAS